MQPSRTVKPAPGYVPYISIEKVKVIIHVTALENELASTKDELVNTKEDQLMYTSEQLDSPYNIF